MPYFTLHYGRYTLLAILGHSHHLRTISDAALSRICFSKFNHIHVTKANSLLQWSLTPLYGGTKELQGLYNAPFETTRQTRATRAMKTLLKLGQETALAKSVSTFWPKILASLSDNIYDFPFAILYSVADDSDEETMSQSSESSQTFKSCNFEGALGVPEGHPAAPKRLDLKRSRGGFVPSFRDALQTREPTLVTTKDGSLSEALIDGIQWRGFPEPCKEALVCPVSSSFLFSVSLSWTLRYPMPCETICTYQRTPDSTYHRRERDGLFGFGSQSSATVR